MNRKKNKTDNWIDIRDNLPKIEETVIVYDTCYGIVRAHLQKDCEYVYWVTEDRQWQLCGVTKWRPDIGNQAHWIIRGYPSTRYEYTCSNCGHTFSEFNVSDIKCQHCGFFINDQENKKISYNAYFNCFKASFKEVCGDRISDEEFGRILKLTKIKFNNVGKIKEKTR